MKRTLLSVLGIGMLMAPPLSAQFEATMIEGSRVRLSAKEVYGSNTGEISPYRVTIWNNSDRPGRWTLSQITTRHGTMKKRFTDRKQFMVDAGETRTFHVLLQRPPEGGYFSSGLLWEGSEVTSGLYQTGGHRANPIEFIADNDLEVALLAPYREHTKKVKRTSEFFTFAAEELMADWRSFYSYPRLVLSGKAWEETLSAEVRSSVRQWVAFGGALYIVSDAEKLPLWGELRLAKGEEATVSYGAGSVTQLLPQEQQTSFTALSGTRQSKNLEQTPSSRELGRSNLFIIVFALAFALLIGPVNLFLLAPAKQRQRLFWTIPAISLAGTACLIIFILLKDGVGGAGSRYLLIRLLPESHEALVIQTQQATTGLLMGSAFELQEKSAILQVRNGGGGNYTIEDPSYTGDWFRGRAVQSHRVWAVRSSRMGVTRVNDASPPEVISSVEGTLATLLYCDDDGKLWEGSQVKTGAKTVLREAQGMSDRGVYEWTNIAMRTNAVNGDQLLKGLIGQDSQFGHRPAPGAFLAHLEDATPMMIGTLSSIRWTDTAVVAGPVQTSTSASR